MMSFKEHTRCVCFLLYVHIPKDNKGIPLPDKLSTPCELVTAALYIDQY